MSALELKDLDYEKIVFEKAKEFETKTGASYMRIPIKYQDPGNKLTELCLATNPLTSLGVKEENTIDKQIDTYSLPLIIDDIETKEVLENILNKCREHLFSNISEYNLMIKKIEDLDIFYRGASEPILYPKLISKYAKPSEIKSKFYILDENDKEVKIDPKELINQKIKCINALVFKEILISSKSINIITNISEVIVLEKILEKDD